jgi:hypothetical protein
MSLPFSDTFHVSAWPRECTETFQAAHVSAFSFFEGVPPPGPRTTLSPEWDSWAPAHRPDPSYDWGSRDGLTRRTTGALPSC